MVIKKIKIVYVISKVQYYQNLNAYFSPHSKACVKLKRINLRSLVAFLKIVSAQCQGCGVPLFSIQPINFVNYFFGQLQTGETSIKVRISHCILAGEKLPVIYPGVMYSCFHVCKVGASCNNVICCIQQPVLVFNDEVTNLISVAYRLKLKVGNPCSHINRHVWKLV